MPNYKVLFLSLFLLAIASASAADKYEWELRRDKDGIQVYTRNVEGSKYKAVRAITAIDTTLNQAVALVRDPTACPEWAALCRESRIEQVISETELYVYSYNDVPWPAKDRDAIARVLWSQDENDLSVTMVADAVEGIVPINEDAVRLKHAVTKWIFVPHGGKVEVTTEAHIDPAGPMPAWIINMLIVDSPFETLTNMRRLLSGDRYADVHFEFLKEPK